MKHRAFTLIELLVVILILVTLSAAAIPMLGSAGTQMELRGAANRVTEMMGLASSLAIVERQTHRLNFDQENGVFWISKQKEPHENPDVYAPLELSGLARVDLAEDLRIKAYRIEAERKEEEQDQLPYIAFRMDGTAEKADVVLESNRGEVYTLMVSRLTGRVRMVNFEPEEEE